MTIYDLINIFVQNNLTFFNPPLSIPPAILLLDITIYFSIIVIGVFLVAYTAVQLNRNHLLMKKVSFATLGNLCGIILIVINLLFTLLVLWYSHGRYTILFQYKGWIASVGYAVFSISMPISITIIVGPRYQVKKMLNYLFYFLIFIYCILTLSVFLNFINISFIPLPFIGIIGFFVIIINISSIAILFIHTKTLVKKYDKRRIYLLIAAISIFTLDFFMSFLDLLLYIPNFQFLFTPMSNIFAHGSIDNLKLLVEYYILPFTRIGTLLLAIILFYCFYFYPDWLQEKLGVLHPSIKLARGNKHLFTLNALKHILFRGNNIE